MRVTWQHLHGSGFRAVIVDMLLKQASGRRDSDTFEMHI